MTQKVPIGIQEARGMFSAFPVALVTAGENVASYGLVHVFSFTPPLIGVGVRRSRYTYEMIEKHGDFGICLPGKDLVSEINFCGMKSGRDVDKFKEMGLTKMQGTKISSVLVKECPVVFECKLHRKIEMPEATHDWFLGEIVAAHKDEGCVADDTLLYWNGNYRLVGEIVGDRKD